MQGGVVALLIAVVGLAAEIIRRAWASGDSVSAQRASLRRQLRAALREGRVTDAAILARALKALGCLLVALWLSGCAHTTPPPIIIGERILMPQPGDVVTVPPLVPPAARWYLVDDVGLCGWLGIEPE